MDIADWVNASRTSAADVKVISGQLHEFTTQGPDVGGEADIYPMMEPAPFDGPEYAFPNRNCSDGNATY
jgi:hypothetical protein